METVRATCQSENRRSISWYTGTGLTMRSSVE